ncbi:hypothetical protein ALT_1534 [Aspergillus lentulus]|uniref:Uncharacterized protein n=1 Tax=Aspergillus lentulus TaxID=293939 RepID=A0AAN5YMG8_ASPLE|nr:uncharacterized protein IFM58399_04086 [Aspergillus lentulus]KAF4154955.1 hypothetical protein CNMCM6069_008550 [Aspergillus lentulus]KAF4167188.1 hypothetical protein CNMCM6936_005578 [Aspergillus lentulus]KAF4174761.1 hypothetical protein CNMCM8060_008324 [Aspergillus lentulus]KAF4183831.1 hypothetical protein CNMCM7927_008789 [Aspergillus lentulus]KAF4193788.1 hypothetical protein CNMCM8694_008383 [Aspergillus lentulus]
MCPMLLSGLADGPAMVLSPRQEHAFVQFPCQSQLDSASAASHNSFFRNGVHSQASSSFSNNVFSAPKLANTAASSSRISRKRSRDEAEFEEALNASSAPAVAAPAPAPKEEPIYGEGMTLINPRTGMALSAESQTGTWYEEQLENAAATAAPVSSRSQVGSSELHSRKSQRLDPSASRVDDITLAHIQQRLHETTDDDNRRLLNAGARTSPLTPNEPQVDDATHLLGISWQRIFTDDVDMAAAVRGWKKYIDKQFAAYLLDSQILMKNRALNAYLVTATPIIPAGPAITPAFYLFSEDLTQAQLVASSWEQCVHNLRSVPVIFEQNQVLNAADRQSSNNSPGVLGLNTTMESGLPLLQTMCAQPVSSDMCAGLNNSVGMATGMEIDT